MRTAVALVSTLALNSPARAQCPIGDLDGAPSVAPATFGHAIAGDDRTRVVALRDAGRPDDGRVLVYRRDASGWWAQEQELAPWDGALNDFGISLALSGSWLAVGANQDDDAGDTRGAVYLFRSKNGTWIPHTKLLPPPVSDLAIFGDAVDLEHGTLVVGAPGDHQFGPVHGSAHFYAFDGDAWVHRQTVFPDPITCEWLGAAVVLHGDVALIGAPVFEFGFAQKSGAAYVYERVGGTWLEQHQLAPPFPFDGQFFGDALDLDATHAVVGAWGWSDVFLFDATDFTAPPLQLDPPKVGFHDRYGRSVSLHEGTAIIGAPHFSGTVDNGGAVFVHSEPTWTGELLELPEPQAGDRFGQQVFLRDGRAMIRWSGACLAMSSGCVSEYAVSDCLGTSYCTAEPNSLGLLASLVGLGSGAAADPGFELLASTLPPQQAVVFLVGQGQGVVVPPGSQGNLCLDGAPIARLGGAQSGGPGLALRPVELGALRFDPPVTVQPGETWNFQAWYRDQNPDPTSNLTDAIHITFR